MSLQIEGVYLAPGSSQSQKGRVELVQEELSLYLEGSSAPHRCCDLDDCEQGEVLAGLAVELRFADGGLFTPDDVRFRWPQTSGGQRALHWLEGHWSAVLAGVLVVPLFLWVMVTKALPAAADASVSLLPDAVPRQLGEQTLYLLDKTLMDPSELSETQQERVRGQWQHALQQLSLDGSGYQLLFRSSKMGANAFALPDGTVVVTDEIVTLMEPAPNALTAVLLHEIGHVEHQHGMKQLARATANSMLFAMVLGDIEGAGEVVIGAGSSLINSAFSRDMESEADHFAHQQLKQLGLSPGHFAAAMRLLAEANHQSLDEGGSGHWTQYLSSHPETLERIHAAEDAAEKQDGQ
ncbi:M48 family metallopeptidase [Ferrimonas futtsuensis]|uniref:M48 family metallopeptidase n=1 Tax=Ferrimonas futtsuensis TaxID=364764 RepID=UPI000400DDA6|nr:M48 family metallopeptidase [Ferrimonas futtsuensis]